jgi:hypothetical protein
MKDKQLLTPPSPDSDLPRLAMKKLTTHWSPCLNRLTQSYFDWLTGYYLQPPLWESNPWLELAYGLFQYVGGLAIVTISVMCATWWTMPFGWWLSIAGAAQLQEVVHFCAHEVFGSKVNKEKSSEKESE